MQISLKDLFAFVAFCAGVFACAAWVGFDNGMFWFDVIVSGIASALFVARARNEKRRKSTLGVTIPYAILSFLITSILLFANAIFLTVLAIFLARKPPPSVKDLCGSVMVVLLVTLFIGLAPGIGELRRLREIRKEYPIVSLEPRLQYEKPQQRITKTSLTNYSDSVGTQLNEQDNQNYDATFRHYQLKRLHDEQYEKFVRSIGFGVARMMYGYGTPNPPEPIRNIQFDEAARENFGAPYGEWRTFWQGGRANGVVQLYTATRNDFLDPESFGAVIEPKTKAVGFMQHALHYPPAAALKDTNVWTLQRLELVSLLKFDTPRVYVLDHLPRMDQLSGDNVPTRALDEFETGALEKLWTQEDVVVHNDGNKYHMLGSLRAAQQCMNCHSVQRGELLGAFSYSLLRNSAD